MKYKLKNSDYFKKAKIICRARKITGKYGHCWDIQNENEEGFNYIDFDKDVDEWYRTLARKLNNPPKKFS